MRRDDPHTPLPAGLTEPRCLLRSRISFTVTSPSIVLKRQLPGERSAVLGRPPPSPVAGTAAAASLVPYSASDSASDGDSDSENRTVGTQKNTTAAPAASAPAKEARMAGEAGAGLGTAAVKKTPPVAPGLAAVPPSRVLTERQPLVPGATSPWTVWEAAPGPPLHSEDSTRSHSSHGSVGCTSPWLVTEKVRWSGRGQVGV